MAKEYEITALDVGREPFVDQNGNTWVTTVFMGVGEPVKWVVKDPTKFKVGDKVYGSITDEKSKAGKPYLRFRREKAPEVTYTQQQDKPSPEYWDNKQSQIKAQWAIGQALNWVKQPESQVFNEIEPIAKQLFAMVDRVANPIDPNEVDIINIKDIPV